MMGNYRTETLTFALALYLYFLAVWKLSLYRQASLLDEENQYEKILYSIYILYYEFKCYIFG